MDTLLIPRLTSIPPDTRIVPAARSLTLPGRLHEAVLLIHGFTGIPGEMEYLGRRLSDAGFGVSIPRLPGHGTNHRDFRASGARDWLRRSVDAYLELAAEYATVYVAGLSMGGLIAVLLAAEFPIARLVLAAPALRTTNPFTRLAPIARFVVPRVPNFGYSDDRQEESEANLLYLRSEYSRYRWVGPVAELRGLQRRALSRLRDIDSAVLTIVSKGDRTVPLSVGALIERRVASREKRVVILEHSGHVVVNGVEKESVADEVVEWFRR